VLNGLRRLSQPQNTLLQLAAGTKYGRVPLHLKYRGVIPSAKKGAYFRYLQILRYLDLPIQN